MAQQEQRFHEAGKVLEWIMDQGHFDNIKKKALEQLKNSAELKQYATRLLDESAVLANPETLFSEKDENKRRAIKKKLIKDIERELEDKLLAEVSKTMASNMTDPNNELCKQIEQRVHEGLCAVYEQHAKELQE